MTILAPCYRRWIKSALYFATLFCVTLFLTELRAADNIRALPGENVSNAYPVSVNGFHIVDFKTENLVAPQGIDVLNPRFSWKLFSQTIGEAQSAYQLIVTKVDGGDLVWDSGKVESNRQLYIRYEGKALEPATEYFVELVVWNKDGSQKSQIYAPFSTGLFPTEADPNPWKGKWIGLNSKKALPEPADISKSNWISFTEERAMPIGASVYRKTFEIENVDDVVASVANISLDNRGEVYINGINVGGSDEYRRVASRELTPYLRNGKNVVAVHVLNIGGEPNPGGAVGNFYLALKDGSKVEYPV